MPEEFKLPTKEELAALTDGQLIDGVATAMEGMRLGWQAYFRQVMLGGAYLWEQRRRKPGAWQTWCRATYPGLAYTTINNYINLYDFFKDKPEKDWPKKGVEEGLTVIRRAKEEVFRRDNPEQAKLKDQEREAEKAKRDKAKEDDAQRSARLNRWEGQLNRAGLVAKDGTLRLDDTGVALLHALAQAEQTEEEATQRPEEADRRSREIAKLEKVLATFFAKKGMTLDFRTPRVGDNVTVNVRKGNVSVVMPPLPQDARVVAEE